jgi:hypothetical protein
VEKGSKEEGYEPRSRDTEKDQNGSREPTDTKQAAIKAKDGDFYKGDSDDIPELEYEKNLMTLVYILLVGSEKSPPLGI